MRSPRPIDRLEESREQRRRQARMSAGHYELVAGIIAAIENPNERRRMASHFGDCFARRNIRFDWIAWQKATGVHR
jgi:hypothetical protein